MHIASSRTMPHLLTKATWYALLTQIKALPRYTSVHFMVRGWDGLSTARSGLEDFIRAHASGYGNKHDLNFEFIFVQKRSSTNADIQDLFG